MTDEQQGQQKRKKPGREIGGIEAQRWNHFGSEDEEGEPSDKPDSQIASNSKSQMVHYPESQQARLPKSQRAESQEKQMVSYLREKKPERKAQIAYLPPDLIKRLKRFAFEQNLEISVVVQQAVDAYLKEHEDTH